jgi:phosphate/sulfate permease
VTLRTIAVRLPTAKPRNLIHAHWLSSDLIACSCGINGSAKIWALLLPIAFFSSHPANSLARPELFTVAAAMFLAAVLAGRTEKLAFQITPLTHLDSILANVSTVLVITTASLLTFPVASMQTCLIGMEVCSGAHFLGRTCESKAMM